MRFFFFFALLGCAWHQATNPLTSRHPDLYLSPFFSLSLSLSLSLTHPTHPTRSLTHPSQRQYASVDALADVLRLVPPQRVPIGPGGSAFGKDAPAKVEAPPRIEAVVAMPKGFMIVGGMGLLAVYERVDDKVAPLSLPLPRPLPLPLPLPPLTSNHPPLTTHPPPPPHPQREPYIETKRIALGSSRLHFAALFPSEERAAVVTKHNRLLLMALDRCQTLISLSLSLTHTHTHKHTRTHTAHPPPPTPTHPPSHPPTSPPVHP